MQRLWGAVVLIVRLLVNLRINKIPKSRTFINPESIPIDTGSQLDILKIVVS